MESRIVLTDNKHIYARVADGILEIRVPRWLSVADRDRVVARLLRRPAVRQKQPSLFEKIREEGTVQWAWGDTVLLPREVQMLPEKDLRRWLLAEARRLWLPQVQAELRSFAVQLPGKRALRNVALRDLRSRWGSCSPEGDIAISLGTLLLPYPLFAYVCAHEVAHLGHLNHSASFWRHLEKVMPDAVQRRQSMRLYHLS